MPPTVPHADNWLQFDQPQVRDLAFLLGSAPLIRAWPQGPAPAIELPDTAFWQQKFTDYLPRLQQLNRQPAPLLQAIAVWPEQRLGLYAEDLLAFWLGDPGWHEFALLDRHRLILQGRRTLGEVDFLVENLDDGAIEHWELTVKFYLGHADFRPAQWIGLDASDRLGRKLHHLLHRQFDPVRTQGLGIERRRAVVKGRLYWPADTAEPTGLDWLEPWHERGGWGPKLPHGPVWRAGSRPEWFTPRAGAGHTPQARYGQAGLYWDASGQHSWVWRPPGWPVCPFVNRH